MNDRQERASRPGPIPKRPSQQPGQSSSHPNDSVVQVKKVDKQLNIVDNRSQLSEMPTIKSEALRPQVFHERKKAAISYAAVVNGRTSIKPNFLAQAISFFLK
jgi:hypothetical protein